MGHIALNMVGYCEKIANNLKSKNNNPKNKDKSSKKQGDKDKEKEDRTKQKKKKKNEEDQKSSGEESEDEIQKINGGQEAEIEYNINILEKIVDEDLLYKNTLGIFTPLILKFVKQLLSGDFTEENLILYKVSLMSLCKFMCVSKKFCEENLQILFDILEQEKIDSNLKLNICVSIGDLVNRFPNLLQKKILEFYKCLKSENIKVVRNTLIVISHLVLNDMIKLNGEIVDICLLLDNEDEKLNDLVNLFISEYSKKGKNVIYNIIPKALAKLNNEYKHLEYDKFQNVIKSLLKFVEKDKQTEGLIERLFMKLKNTQNKKEWRNTTYCLSLLNYNEKGLNKVSDLFSNLKEKVDDDIVKENLNNIFIKFRKNPGLSGIAKESLDAIEKNLFSNGKFSNMKNNLKSGRGLKNTGRIGSKRTNSKIDSYFKSDKRNSSNDNDDSDFSEENYESKKNSKRKNNINVNLSNNNSNSAKGNSANNIRRNPSRRSRQNVVYDDNDSIEEELDE